MKVKLKKAKQWKFGISLPGGTILEVKNVDGRITAAHPTIPNLSVAIGKRDYEVVEN